MVRRHLPELGPPTDFHQPVGSSPQYQAPKSNLCKFKQAYWPNFSQQIEEAMSSPPSSDDVFSHKRFLRKVKINAAKNNIPCCKIPAVDNVMSTDTARLVDERDRIRKENPADSRIKDLNKEINIHVCDHRKKKWLEHLSVDQEPRHSGTP